MTDTTEFRPTSRNTCPYPGCDEPRGDGFAETCTEHASPGDVVVIGGCEVRADEVVTAADLLDAGYTDEDASDDGYTDLAEAAQDATINGWLAEVSR